MGDRVMLPGRRRGLVTFLRNRRIARACTYITLPFRRSWRLGSRTARSLYRLDTIPAIARDRLSGSGSAAPSSPATPPPTALAPGTPLAARVVATTLGAHAARRIAGELSAPAR
jgi:hypothetical protein